MARTIGYYFTLNNSMVKKHKDEPIRTKTRAIREAEDMLGNNVKHIGIVRANDDILLFKVYMKKGQVVKEKV